MVRYGRDYRRGPRNLENRSEELKIRSRRAETRRARVSPSSVWSRRYAGRVMSSVCGRGSLSLSLSRITKRDNIFVTTSRRRRRRRCRLPARTSPPGPAIRKRVRKPRATVISGVPRRFRMKITRNPKSTSFSDSWSREIMRTRLGFTPFRRARGGYNGPIFMGGQ